MSRYVQKIDDEKDIAYGYDHVEGYFFQVFGIDEDGQEILLVDESSLFSDLTNHKMIELMLDYNIENNTHLIDVANDLPF